MREYNDLSNDELNEIKEICLNTKHRSGASRYSYLYRTLYKKYDLNLDDVVRIVRDIDLSIATSKKERSKKREYEFIEFLTNNYHIRIDSAVELVEIFSNMINKHEGEHLLTYMKLVNKYEQDKKVV